MTAHCCYDAVDMGSRGTTCGHHLRRDATQTREWLRGEARPLELRSNDHVDTGFAELGGQGIRADITSSAELGIRWILERLLGVPDDVDGSLPAVAWHDRRLGRGRRRACDLENCERSEKDFRMYHLIAIGGLEYC